MSDKPTKPSFITTPSIDTTGASWALLPDGTAERIMTTLEKAARAASDAYFADGETVHWANVARAAISAVLLDPSDEAVRAAMFAVCKSDGEYGINPRHLCADGCVQENGGARCPYESDARAALRAAGVKIAGKD